MDVPATDLPWWTGVIEAAEAWGCPPWDIAPGGKFLWFARWQSYRGAVNKAMKERREKDSKQARSRRRR